MECLGAMLDPLHEAHARTQEWYGRPFDPDDIDERSIRIVLRNIAKPRRGALAGLRNRRSGPGMWGYTTADVGI